MNMLETVYNILEAITSNGRVMILPKMEIEMENTITPETITELENLTPNQLEKKVSKW